MGRRGPKTTWAEDADRHPVVGLVLRRDGRYLAHENRNKTFGKDRDDAIRQFYAWQNRNQTVSFQDVGPPSRAVVKSWEHGAQTHPDPEWRDHYAEALAHNETIKAVHSIQESAYWQRVTADIRKNPKLFARKTGIPEIAYLSDLTPPAPSITLEELGNLYNNKRDLSEKWKRQTRQFWREFRSIVRVKTAREITRELMEKFEDAVLDAGKSPTYVKHRFTTIKTIFAYAMKRGKDQSEIRRVLDLCKTLIPPKSKRKNPQPISVEHFHALLSACDAKWTAVFLLSLNAALYPSEVAAILKTEIDLDAKTLRMDRGKTGIHRIAILWDRTVNAIREYQATEPHDHDRLFVNEIGQPYDANHMGRNLRRRRVKAKLPESVEFAHIRDGAETAAIEGGADLTAAKLLAGHSIGISDHYVRRNPKMVSDVCRIIEAHYFPKE